MSDAVRILTKASIEQVADNLIKGLSEDQRAALISVDAALGPDVSAVFGMFVVSVLKKRGVSAETAVSCIRALYELR